MDKSEQIIVMKWKIAFFALLFLIIIGNCNRNVSREITVENLREFAPGDISSFHPELRVSVGWAPYEEKEMVPAGRNKWLVLNGHDAGRTGLMPFLMVTYPKTKDSIYLDMEISNELLGKLIKHSAMTQVPIARPFTSFFDNARCEKCHPPHIRLPVGE